MILNSTGVNIGVIVVSNIEKLEQFKIVSRLYNGSYSVQTVGDKARYNRVRVYATLLQKYALDDIEADAEEITLTYKDFDCNEETYVGVIRNPINWSPFKSGVSYYGEFDLLIKEV